MIGAGGELTPARDAMLDSLSTHIDYLRDREPSTFSEDRFQDDALRALRLVSAKEDIISDLCAALDLDRDDPEDLASIEEIAAARVDSLSRSLTVCQARNYFNGLKRESDAEIEKAKTWDRAYEKERAGFTSLRITRSGRRTVYRGTRRN